MLLTNVGLSRSICVFTPKFLKNAQKLLVRKNWEFWKTLKNF